MSRCFDVTQFSFTIVFPLITTFYLTYIIFIGFVSLLYVVAVVTSSANSSLSGCALLYLNTLYIRFKRIVLYTDNQSSLKCTQMGYPVQMNGVMCFVTGGRIVTVLARTDAHDGCLHSVHFLRVRQSR